jgi:hypothetical protein
MGPGLVSTSPLSIRRDKNMYLMDFGTGRDEKVGKGLGET